MRHSKMISALVIAGVIGAGAAGCEKKGPAEKAGEKVDSAVEKAGKKLEKAGDEAERKTER